MKYRKREHEIRRIDVNKDPKVSIILVNYNGYQDTIECLKSLQNLKYNNFEVIIVENGSNDYDAIRDDKFLNENAIVILEKENGGFSAGNNIGIRYALEHGTDYVFLLNNDTTIDSQAVRYLVDASEEDDKIGITTGNIYYYSQPEELWYSNGIYNYKKGATYMVNDASEEVSFVCGCMMLIKRAVIEQIGFLSDDFFLYSEDTEYDCRAVAAGWKLKWTPKAKVYHKISASTVENSDFQQYYMIRNNLLIVKRYGTHKMYGYIYRLYQTIKAIKNKNCTIKALRWACMDFARGRLGKSKRF